MTQPWQFVVSRGIHKIDCCSWVFHSFDPYLLKTYCVPGIVPGFEVRVLTETDKTLTPSPQHGAYVLGLCRESEHKAT